MGQIENLEHYPTRFRASLLYRLGDRDLSPYGALLDGNLEPISTPAAFVDRVFHEFAEIEKRVDWIWRRRITGGGEQRPQLNLMGKLHRLEAWISVASTRSRPDLNVSLGTLLAFDDLCLRVLCDDLLLAPSREAVRIHDIGEAPADFNPTVGSSLERNARFVDYADAFNDGKIDLEALTYQMPTAPWRLCQASLLSELLIAFTLFHERCHYGLGHLDLLSRHFPGHTVALHESAGPELRGVGKTAPKTPIKPGTYRVLEMQADNWAYLLLCAYCQDEDGPANRYTQYLDSLGVERNPLRIHDITLPVAVRLCQTAAALACLAFRLASPPQLKDDPSHPHPYTRMLYMVQKTPILSPLVDADEGGDFVLETKYATDEDGNETADFVDLVQTSIGMSLTDVHLSAELVDPEFRLLRRENEDASLKVDSWIEDLARFWVSDDESLNEAARTESGLEFEFLLSIQPEIQEVLAHVQRDHFGEEISLDVGKIGDALPSADPDRAISDRLG